MKFYLVSIKELSVMSLIFGAILGIISLVPYVGILAFLICTFASGSIILDYMQKIKLIDKPDTKDWSINGAISGFIAFAGFSLTFIPLAAIIGMFTKNSYHYGITIMLKNGFFMLLFLIIFVAVTAAVTNSFGAMLYSWIIKIYKSQTEK